MNINSRDNASQPTLDLRVRIDKKRADMLYANAAPAFRDRDRFVPMDEYDQGPEAAWAKGTLFWCELGIEAMVLADFEEACGYSSMLLSDEYVWGPHEPGYVVLSSRPFPIR